MKLSMISKSLLPGLTLLLATSAFAANKGNKGSLDLGTPATIAGHQLAPGEYKLTWDGTGSNVELMILSHGKLVATVPAHLIELSQPERNDAIESGTNADGSQTLNKIDFAGKKYALAFGEEATMTESASQGTRRQQPSPSISRLSLHNPSISRGRAQNKSPLIGNQPSGSNK